VLEHEGQFGLGLGLDQLQVDAVAAWQTMPEVSCRSRAEDAEHVLHRLAGHADLLADDGLAGPQAAATMRAGWHRRRSMVMSGTARAAGR
jgi:hypothetical protein